MDFVRVELADRSYTIYISSGLMGEIGDFLTPFNLTSKNMLITNPTVYGLYGQRLLNSIHSKDIHCKCLIIPDGETYKDYFWAYHILSEMLKEGLDRKSCLFALGGGVIGDITGFCASIYMRGIPFIQIPTTLLAQVDSSVGGKTGVNHPLGKNMIGSFYQPMAVFIDTNTLNTLPNREFLAGMAEVIKYGVIWDDELFQYLDTYKDEIFTLAPARISHIIRRCCEIKAEIVGKDEKEQNIRAILNFGHTIAHALETETNYEVFKHGEAVAIGMVAEANIAKILGITDDVTVKKITDLIFAYGLPTYIPMSLNKDSLIHHMQKDKKSLVGRITIITPKRIGEVKVTKDVDIQHIKPSLNLLEVRDEKDIGD
ncbi:MAG: 3-dehydroquinate synthase [Thermodesulfovibrionales bacterium]|nr:3-dehydroquinate synthase [Thermodesulfovibrionales bacterium]